MDYGFGLALDPFYTFWYINRPMLGKNLGLLDPFMKNLKNWQNKAM